MEAKNTPPARPATSIPVGIGFSYRDKATGLIWILAGLRSGHTVILEHNGQLRDRVGLEELADGYEHEGCDHSQYCCTLHRTHVMPHRGCMMR